MTQLTDAIKAAGVENICRSISADPNFRVFNLMWNAPEELIPACDAMGFQTVDDVIAWVNRVNQAIGAVDAFERLIDPPVTVPQNMPVIAWPEIHKALAAQTKLSSDLQIERSDATYSLPTEQQWRAIAAACPVKRRRHSGNDSFDCDDFTNAFRGWLAMKGLGNCAHGFVGTRHFRDQQIIGGHAMVAVMDASEKVWFIEPQNGQLYAPDKAATLGGYWFANRLEVARVLF